MRLFKSTFKNAAGKTVKTAKWYVEFRDQRGQVRRIPAFTSKAASEELGRNLDKLVAYHKGTGGQVDPALSDWLTSLPENIRQLLGDCELRSRGRSASKSKVRSGIGLIEAERAAASKPLSGHLEDFRASLLARGVTARQVELVCGRTKRIIDGCGFTFWSHVTASRVLTFVHGLQADVHDENGKLVKRGISAQTFNFYVAAVKQFCRWAVKDRRIAESQVAHLDGLNVKLDRRHDRRSLTSDELRRLITVAKLGRVRFGMTGVERSLLYRLAAESGLRANELRTLTWDCLRLEGTEPTLLVKAANAKNRREDLLPLKPTTARLLAQWSSSREAVCDGEAVFGMTSGIRFSEVLQEDLKAAGIPFQDAEGRFADFHALRHSFISALTAGGIHPKTAQKLARHSTIALTMDRYTHTIHCAESAALGALPDLDAPTATPARKTGTYDKPIRSADGAERLALCLAQSGQREATSLDCRGREAESAAVSEVPLRAGVSADLAAKTRNGSVRTPGGSLGLQNR